MERRHTWDNPQMKSVAKSELFRELPSVDELIRTPAVAALASRHGTVAVTAATRAVLARLREEGPGAEGDVPAKISFSQRTARQR